MVDLSKPLYQAPEIGSEIGAPNLVSKKLRFFWRSEAFGGRIMNSNSISNRNKVRVGEEALSRTEIRNFPEWRSDADQKICLQHIINQIINIEFLHSIEFEKILTFSTGSY